VKVAFVSNYLNHHQLPFCLAMDKLTGGQFTFVATTPVPQERLSMGYHDMNRAYPFVLTAYDDPENEKKAMELALSCDMIITGSAPEVYTEARVRQNKLTFRYSERLYKQGLWRAFSPRGIASRLLHHTRYAAKPLYMLCASAYTAFDFSLTGAYIGKTYKWGYFPEVKELDLDALFEEKHKNGTMSVLWAGRMISWKHPEVMISLAKYLREQGKRFRIDMIGNGELEHSLAASIRANRLEDCVHMLGAMSPEAVREHMEKADVFVFSSDFNEGWGAVLNESMNSACAVVASHAIGSVPFLLKDGENGLIYKNGDTEDLCRKVCSLLDAPEEREKLGRAAYETLHKEWNAQTAAQRLLQLAEDLMQDKKCSRFATGPCSLANRISNSGTR